MALIFHPASVSLPVSGPHQQHSVQHVCASRTSLMTTPATCLMTARQIGLNCSPKPSLRLARRARTLNAIDASAAHAELAVQPELPSAGPSLQAANGPAPGTSMHGGVDDMQHGDRKAKIKESIAAAIAERRRAKQSQVTFHQHSGALHSAHQSASAVAAAVGGGGGVVLPKMPRGHPSPAALAACQTPPAPPSHVGPQSAEAARAETQEQAEAPLCSEARERLRRQRISEANVGKQPWNKGRKHSPETIAKIRERTRAAMQRPDVVQAYKDGVARHMKNHSEETKAKIKASVSAAMAERRQAKQLEKEAKAAAAAAAAVAAGEAGPSEKAAEKGNHKRASKAKPSSQGDGTSTSSPDGQDGDPDAPKTPRKRPSRAKAKTESVEPAEPKQPKERAKPSEEHRRNIAAAIRAKWQDPNYRAKTVGAIQKHVYEKFGVEPGTSRRARAKAAGGGSSSSSRRSSAAAMRKQMEVRLAQIKQVVSQIIAAKALVGKFELNVDATRLKMQAFLNDSRMAARAATMISEAESALSVAREKLGKLSELVPAGVRYDETGAVYVSDPTVLLMPAPGAPTAGVAAPGVPLAPSTSTHSSSTQSDGPTASSSLLGAAAEAHSGEPGTAASVNGMHSTLHANGNTSGVHLNGKAFSAAHLASAPGLDGLSAHSLLAGTGLGGGVQVNGANVPQGTGPDAWVKVESVEQLLAGVVGVATPRAAAPAKPRPLSVAKAPRAKLQAAESVSEQLSGEGDDIVRSTRTREQRGVRKGRGS